MLVRGFQRGSTPSGSRKCRWSNKRKWFAGGAGVSHNGFHFLIWKNSLRVTHTSIGTHRYTSTQWHRHKAKKTHTKGSEGSGNLLAATIGCDQPSNAICSCCWTAHHMEVFTGRLWPSQRWKRQEIKGITWISGLTERTQTRYLPKQPNCVYSCTVCGATKNICHWMKWTSMTLNLLLLLSTVSKSFMHMIRQTEACCPLPNFHSSAGQSCYCTYCKCGSFHL